MLRPPLKKSLKNEPVMLLLWDVPPFVPVIRLKTKKPVRKTAQGAAMKVCPKPEESSEAWVMSAENSRDRPGPNRASVPALAPSSVSRPPATLALPFGGNHSVADIPAGRASPENSAPKVGARITSPSAVSATYAPASTAPALKSALVVSRRVAGALSGRVLVAAPDPGRRTADRRKASGSVILRRGIPWKDAPATRRSTFGVQSDKTLTPGDEQPPAPYDSSAGTAR